MFLALAVTLRESFASLGSNACKKQRYNWLTACFYDRGVPHFVRGSGVDCSSKAALANMRPSRKVLATLRHLNSFSNKI